MGSAAFLAPLTRTSPLSRCPPLITILSTKRYTAEIRPRAPRPWRCRGARRTDRNRQPASCSGRLSWCGRRYGAGARAMRVTAGAGGSSAGAAGRAAAIGSCRTMVASGPLCGPTKLPTDTVARIVAEGMRKPLGQPIIIENVAGGSATIGVGRLARAYPARLSVGSSRGMAIHVPEICWGTDVRDHRV